MIYYIAGIVSTLQKDAKALHTQMKQAFPDRDILVYITDHDEHTTYPRHLRPLPETLQALQ